MFFSRDCAGGAGPTVDAPRPVFSPAGPAVAVLVSGAAVVIVGAPVVAVVIAGVDVVGVDVVVAGFPTFANMLLPEVAVVVAGSAAVVLPSENILPDGAGVVTDSVAVDLAALGNKPPAVAGFGVESVVLIPTPGNKLGVEVDVDVEAAVVVSGLFTGNKLPLAAGVVEPAGVVVGAEPIPGNRGF